MKEEEEEEEEEEEATYLVVHERFDASYTLVLYASDYGILTMHALHTCS